MIELRYGKKSMDRSFAVFLPHIRRRWLEEQRGWDRRRTRALESARRAASVLRARHGATQVIAFGSLVRTGPFDEHSDVDLAAAGIPARDFFRASADAAAACDFELDLVDLADCPSSLRDAILREGMSL